MPINENLIESTKLFKARKPAEDVLPEASVQEEEGQVHGYQEVPGRSGHDTDVLQQLRANVTQLQELQAKVRFVLNEVNGLVKR